MGRILVKPSTRRTLLEKYTFILVDHWRLGKSAFKGCFEGGEEYILRGLKISRVLFSNLRWNILRRINVDKQYNIIISVVR